MIEYEGAGSFSAPLRNSICWDTTVFRVSNCIMIGVLPPLELIRRAEVAAIKRKETGEKDARRRRRGSE